MEPVICPQTQPPTILNDLSIDARSSSTKQIEIENQEITPDDTFIYNQLAEETKLIAIRVLGKCIAVFLKFFVHGLGLQVIFVNKIKRNDTVIPPAYYGILWYQ